MINSSHLGLALLLSILSSFLLSTVVLAYAIDGERKRTFKEQAATKNRRLRFVDSSKEVPTPLDEEEFEYHLFLSHVWATGQDQMRIIKQRLLEMCPNLSIFLDVDDLKEIGDLEAYIDHTHSVLIFCSSGYFSSQNCMRELVQSVYRNKPIITLLEPELNKGGLTRADIKDRLEKADVDFYDQWGMVKQFEEWGWQLPIAQKLYDALFAEAPNEWNRIGDFQDITLRLVAERLLALPSDSTYIAGALKTAGGLTMPALSQDHVFHVYISKHNPGAARLVREAVYAQECKFRVSQMLDDLHSCAKMLIYLTDRTWTSGETSSAFAEEVAQAMDSDIPILLAHEMPGEQQEGRNATEFKNFFVCDEGTTPAPLLKRGIYKTIAVALKGGEWRKASMVRLCEGLGAVELSTRGMMHRTAQKKLSETAHHVQHVAVTTMGASMKDLNKLQRNTSFDESTLAAATGARRHSVGPTEGGSKPRRSRFKQMAGRGRKSAGGHDADELDEEYLKILDDMVERDRRRDQNLSVLKAEIAHKLRTMPAVQRSRYAFLKLGRKAGQGRGNTSDTSAEVPPNEGASSTSKPTATSSVEAPPLSPTIRVLRDDQASVASDDAEELAETEAELAKLRHQRLQSSSPQRLTSTAEETRDEYDITVEIDDDEEAQLQLTSSASCCTVGIGMAEESTGQRQNRAERLARSGYGSIPHPVGHATPPCPPPPASSSGSATPFRTQKYVFKGGPPFGIGFCDDDERGIRVREVDYGSKAHKIGVPMDARLLQVNSTSVLNGNAADARALIVAAGRRKLTLQMDIGVVTTL